MEKKETDVTKIFLVIVTIIVLIVAVVGASFAYFNAATTTGNLTNKINTATAEYGTLSVGYPGTNGSIEMSTIDLPYSTRSSKPIVQRLLKFTVTASADANTDVAFNLKWGGVANVSNNFCQYRSSVTTCTNVNTDTDVRGELYFNLYECSEAGYTNTTIANDVVTIGEGCTALAENVNAPYTDAEKTAKLNDTPRIIDISQSRIKYYALTLNLKNLTTVQDYNQGKTFTGALSIEGATN